MIFKKAKGEPWIIVGLGNPGLEYENTRHNAGFAAIDLLAEKLQLRLSKHKFDAVFTDTVLGDRRIFLVKPQTYMNNSGSAVAALSRFYKIPSDRILVIFDDISLSVGKIRIRRNGSHGGHNGIKDITQLLGTNDIKRIKVGVGERPNREYDLKDWVLGKIPEEQQAEFKKALEKTVKAVEETVTKGIDSAMNKYNG